MKIKYYKSTYRYDEQKLHIQRWAMYLDKAKTSMANNLILMQGGHCQYLLPVKYVEINHLASTTECFVATDVPASSKEV